MASQCKPNCVAAHGVREFKFKGVVCSRRVFVSITRRLHLNISVPVEEYTRGHIST